MRLHRSTCVFAVLAAAALAAPPASAAEIVLKSATALTKTLSLTHTFLQVCNEINAKEKGKLRIDYLGGPEVTPPGKVAEALKRGLIDLLHGPASYYNGAVPEGDAILVSERTPAEVRANGGMALLEKIWNKKLNAHILAWFESGFQASKDAPVVDLYNLYFTKKPPLDPVNGLNLKGFKMRTTATYRPLLRALGATPVGMPNTEIYTALQRGVVDGFGFPGVALTGLGLAHVVKYRVDPAFYKGNNLVLINLDRWKAMPHAMQEMLTKTFQGAEVRSNVYIGADAKKEEETMKAGGMKIITLTGKPAADYHHLAYNLVWKRLEQRVPKEAKEIRAKFDK